MKWCRGCGHNVRHVVKMKFAIQTRPRIYKLDGQDKLRVSLELPEPADRLRAAGELLETLSAKSNAA